MTQRLDRFLEQAHIAYFSMEIAIRPEMHTYSGGLGVLAGDTVRSCADLEIPSVFVTLEIPILLLDSDLEQNDSEDRKLTHQLYGDGQTYRLKQELILGLGGIRLLRALGFRIQIYHLNEGHAAFLTLDLLNRHRFPSQDVRPGEPLYDLAKVRERCVFTTHTPVEAGHDRFSYELLESLVPDLVEFAELKQLAGPKQLNMTQLALNLAGYINGVARRHAETTRHMFPGYRVYAITNGVHVGHWTHPAFAQLFTTNWPHWSHEPEILVRALQLSDREIWNSHMTAKAELVEQVQLQTGVALNPDTATLGFARRMTGYKRPLLLFSDIERLRTIASRHPVQIVLAGKAHPKDQEGKEAIRRLLQLCKDLRGRITCVFLPNYDMKIAQAMVSGVDVWVNTPLPPMEASGTSGMKAALNGVLNLSVLDGWWIEACVEGVTGWSIGNEDEASTAAAHGGLLYDKLDTVVLPLFYADQTRWRAMMKQSIGYIGYYFNSQRMMRRYASEAYLR
jgi:glycogen phosphorylase